MKNHIAIMITLLITTILISSIFGSAVNFHSNNNLLLSEPQFFAPYIKKTPGLEFQYLQWTDDEISTLNGGSSLDQYQTYADCWIGTNYYVIKLAQSFKPTLEFLDYIKVKVWLNFTSPTIDIKFYIYDNAGSLPGSVITGGISEIYSSDDFWFSSSVPDPYNEVPWYTIEFPDDPSLTVGQEYWFVMDIVVHLSGDKHVLLAGELFDGDPYPDGHFAYYTDDYQWRNDYDVDLMFKTYGYNLESNPPSADAGGPYYGYIGGGEMVSFDGRDSHDNDEGGQSIERYDWKFYEGDSWHNNIGPTPSHTYANDGTYEATLRVHDDEEETDTDTTTVTIYPPGPPHVNYVESFYADGSDASHGLGLFLQGMDLLNTYTASVSGADIDQVKFELGFQSHTDYNGVDGWTVTFNTKDIVNPYAELKIKAHNQHGWGEYKTYNPRIIPMAGWMVQFIDYVCNYNDTDFASFSISIKDTPPLEKNNYWILNAAFDFSTGSPENPEQSPVEAGVEVPVDDVGGDYSYSGGIGSSLSVCSDGSVDVSGGFEASITAKNISGGIGASIHGSLTIGDEIVWNYMYLTIHGEVTIPVFYIPLQVCGIGVEAGIDITPHVEITFYLDPTADPNGGIVPGLGIKIKDEEGIEGNVGATVRAYAEAGFVIGEFYTEAGGDGTLYFQTPSPPGYFKDFVLSCWIGGRLRLLFWTIEGWWEYEWRYSDLLLTSKGYNETAWGPIDRDYINPDHGEYNEFVWDEHSNSGTAIRNVFPYANPYITYFPGSAGNKVMMVWAHDNKDKPRVNGMEVQYTIWERNEDMEEPQPIPGTNDDKLQMDPKISFDKDGDVVCVFIQTDSSISETSYITDVCNATEVAYSVWNKTSETWSSIYTITNNNRMDMSPVIASNSNGDIVLVWTEDRDNDHTTINDRNIYSSFWDGNGWSEIQTVVENQPLVSTPQVAINEDKSETICVFTMDGDNNLSTPNDQNIFYTAFSQGISGKNIVQFTEDYVYQNTAPSVVYGEDGNAYIIWLKNEYIDHEDEEIYNSTLYYKRVGLGREIAHAITSGTVSDPIAIPSQGSSKFDDFNFAVGWGGSSSSHTLHCAKVKVDNEIESGVIYGSELKLSEIHWSIAPGSITAATVERPILKNHSKNCDLSFIFAPGFDRMPPLTECTLDGGVLGYGEYGPIYRDSVEISLNATDDGGSGLDTTFYRLDFSSWQIYDGTPLTIYEKKPHILEYYSMDKAENRENTSVKIFEIVQTRAPEIPFRPWGPTNGKAGEEYTYYSVTTDPDRDLVYYMWDWGDGIDDWIGPYYSGEICEASHIWEEQGDYEIKVLAMDIYDIESEDWSDPLPISMPVNQLSFNSQTIFHHLRSLFYQLKLNK